MPDGHAQGKVVITVSPVFSGAMTTATACTRARFDYLRGR
jgi:hypothetical protein